MAIFPNIDNTRPLGSEKVSVVDDAIRETRGWVKQCLTLMSGFPDLVAPFLPAWNTAGRPTGSLKEGLFGYNSQTRRFERVQSGVWTSLPIEADNATTAGGVTVTIGGTLPAAPVAYRNVHFHTNRLTYIYTPSGWQAMGAVYV